MVVVDPKITVRTERLLIRPLVLEDAADINIMRANPEVMKYTPTLPCDSLEKTEAWIKGCHNLQNNWNFSIELLERPSSDSPRVIGNIGAVRAPEVGYMLHADYWGKGYATEALRAFMPLFFDHYSGGEQGRFEYAEALTDPELFSSHNVLRKAGFKLVEKRENDFQSPALGLRGTYVWRRYRDDSAADHVGPAEAH